MEKRCFAIVSGEIRTGPRWRNERWHRSKPGSRSHPDPHRAERHLWRSVANPTTNERGKYYSFRFIWVLFCVAVVLFCFGGGGYWFTIEDSLNRWWENVIEGREKIIKRSSTSNQSSSGINHFGRLICVCALVFNTSLLSDNPVKLYQSLSLCLDVFQTSDRKGYWEWGGTN